ncbi:hypothetical protein SDC9_59215 [bioreactor metagenome]|uniref:Uncharacterized protein n=1 Tax=bioreactor metagenome TaxID=1076179 RepID=A0A644XAT7_9ZZZZ
MAVFLAVAVITVLALNLLASSARWACLIVLGLLVYAFPLHLLMLVLIAGGFLYYLNNQ